MLQKKWVGTVVAAIAAIALAASGFWFGWAAGRQYPKNITITDLSHIGAGTSTTTAVPADFGVFWEAWQDINDLYLRNPSTTAQQKVRGAMAGLVASLGDPYTEYFAPADSKQFQQDIAGNFGGIGAQLGLNSRGDLVVIAPLAETPAARAGLKPQDRILSINGTSTQSMGVNEAVSLIRGPINTAVTLLIMREGFEKPKDFKIIRATINVPNVEFKMKGKIAVITLNEFTQDADYLFYQALVKAVANHAEGIVIDLRNDPGGYLEVAVDLAGYFVKSNSIIVKEVGRTVQEQDYRSTGDGALIDMPLVVLINGGSASASEILAGALRDLRGTKLVGTQSFGKGTVQQLEDLADGSAIKITVAHWVLPSGKIIDHEGLKPDYVVTSTEEEAADGKDAQLEKALEVVTAQIKK